MLECICLAAYGTSDASPIWHFCRSWRTMEVGHNEGLYIRLNISSSEESRAAIIILVMALSCVGLFVRGFDSGTGQALSCLLSSVALAVSLLLRPLAGFWRYVRLPFLFLVAALAWLVIVGLLRAAGSVGESDLPYAPDLFLAKFLSVVAGLWSLMMGAIVGVRPDDRRRAIDALQYFITIFSVAGLYLLFVPDEGTYWPSFMFARGRFLGLIGNANVTACICGAGVMLCLARLLAGERSGSRGKWLTVVHAMMLLFNFAALLLTASRFAALTTIILAIILCVYRGFESGWSMRRGAVPAIMGILLALSSLSLFADTLFHRAVSIGTDGFARWTFWSHFAHIGNGAPWTGYGPGSFPQANIYFLQHSGADVLQTWEVNSPHSIILQLLFVGGIPYFLLIGCAAVLIGRGLIRILRDEYASLVLGSIFASFVIFAVGMVDLALDMPASTNLALLLIGLSWTSGFRPWAEDSVR